MKFGHSVIVKLTKICALSVVPDCFKVKHFCCRLIVVNKNSCGLIFLITYH